MHPLFTLPYNEKALAPHLSAEAVRVHLKHHSAYIVTLNRLIEGTELANVPLTKLATKEGGVGNCAAQAWAHERFWESMCRGGGGRPNSGSAFLELAHRDHGSFDQLREKFARVAETQFGSGWAWLLAEREAEGTAWKLTVRCTPNAVVPVGTNERVLLAIDVWEHAYYLDYRSDRAAFVKQFFLHLVDWEGAARRLDVLSSQPGGEANRG